jgi:shikimate kinase
VKDGANGDSPQAEPPGPLVIANGSMYGSAFGVPSSPAAPWWENGSSSAVGW